MSVPRGELYLQAQTGLEDFETVVQRLVVPVADEIRHDPQLASLFFVRTSEPSCQVRLRVVGEPAWLDERFRPAAQRRLRPLAAEGVVTGVEWDRYHRELERYGGEEGMALAEELYLHDSLACVDLLRLEAAGEPGRGRREVALLLGEWLADRLELQGAERERFYHFGYHFVLAAETWNDDDFAQLEARADALDASLTDQLQGATARDPVALWGGEAAAAVVRRFQAAGGEVLGRVLAAHRAGRLDVELPYLGWSYGHLFCNRLGITPGVEAILRYLAHLYHRAHPAAGEPPATA